MNRMIRLTDRAALAWLLALMMKLSLTLVPAQAGSHPAPDRQLLSLINADRAAEGLRPLQPAADIRAVALAWSTTLAGQRRMQHHPDYQDHFCCWRRAAENVGWTTVSDLDDPATVAAAEERVHEAFMASPTHRANLMHPDHDDIGIGIVLRAGSCPDHVAIRDCMWVTTNFRDSAATPVARHVATGAPAPRPGPAPPQQLGERRGPRPESRADDDVDEVLEPVRGPDAPPRDPGDGPVDGLAVLRLDGPEVLAADDEAGIPPCRGQLAPQLAIADGAPAVGRGDAGLEPRQQRQRCMPLQIRETDDLEMPVSHPRALTRSSTFLVEVPVM